MRRAARYGAYVIAGLIALALAAALVLPELLDRPRMAAQIQAKLSAVVQGEVSWKEFKVRLLPTPHITLRGLRVETAGATLAADEVIAALRLWPLFRGSAEITSLKVARPVVRHTIVLASSVPEEAQLAPPQDALQAYRSVMSAVVDALREFAPDTVVEIENAEVALRIEDLPPIELNDLTLRAQTSARAVELNWSATSRYWTKMTLVGHVEYADLTSTAELRLVRVQGQAWLDWLLKSSGISVALPDVDLTARFHGDPAKALELEVEGGAPTLAVTRAGRRLAAAPIVLKAKLTADASGATVDVTRVSAGATALAGGKLTYTRKDKAISGDVGYVLDLAQALGYARELAPEPLARIESLTGALNGRLRFSLHGNDWRVGASVDKSDAALQVKDVPGPIRLTRVTAVEVDARSVRAERVAVSLPVGDVTVSKARYGLKDGAATANAEFDFDLTQALALLRGVVPEIVESASGHLRGSAKADLNRKGWTAGLDVAQSDAQAKLKPLPAPVSLTGLQVRAKPDSVTIERAGVKLLDASATASATITHFSDPRIQASVSQATIGPKLVSWGWQLAQLPPGLELKAPIQLNVPKAKWGPGSALDVNAEARFDSGPAIGVDLAWSPEALEVRRATLKDKLSDVSLSLSKKGQALEGKYDGTLDSRSIAALLKNAVALAGSVSGELAFTFDRGAARRTSMQGALKSEGLDLTWLAGKPAKIERIDLTADAAGLKITEATVDWAGQRATLRGEVKPGASGPMVDAQIESPGVLVDALLPKATSEKKPKGKPPEIWPLPLTGRIALRSAFIQSGSYKVAPVSAIVTLEESRAQLEVKEAQLCGVALPLSFEATPAGFKAAARITARKQKLEETMHCLSGEKLQLTGVFDATADLRTEGKAEDLLRNLRGSVNADVRDGKVIKFALIGNILSMRNVVAMLGQGGPKLTADGFPFRRLSVAGRFDKSRFLIDEGVFHSNAIGLGANGWISLADFQSNLTVLVAPLALLNEAVGMVPVLGYVAGGALTSLPVAVSGDIRDPLVVPLGPRAITSELKGILDRSVNLPSKLAPVETKP